MFEVTQICVCVCFVSVCEKAGFVGCHYVRALTLLKCTGARWSRLMLFARYCSTDSHHSPSRTNPELTL